MKKIQMMNDWTFGDKTLRRKDSFQNSSLRGGAEAVRSEVGVSQWGGFKFMVLKKLDT